MAVEVAENLARISEDLTLGGRRPKPTSQALDDARADMNPKDAIGRNKPSMHALPPKPLFDIAAVFKVEQYGLWNWRDKPVMYSVYTDAIYRHMAELLERQDLDPDSGKSHLAHIAANAIILMDALEYGTLIDDRWKRKERR